MAQGQESYFILACMDRQEAYAIPYVWLKENKQNLNMTDKGERSYWHIAINTLSDGNLAINVSKIGNKVPLTPYRFAFAAKRQSA